MLVEECEAYFFHRHGFSIWKSYGSWAATLLRELDALRAAGTAAATSTTATTGTRRYSVYGTSGSIIENCVSENEANGFQIHGIENPLDPSGTAAATTDSRERVGGRQVAGLVSSRDTGGEYHNALGNVFRDFVAVSTTGIGLYLRGAADTVVENVTLYGSRDASGLVADGGASGVGGTCGAANPQGCGFTARNVLALDNDELRHRDRGAGHLERRVFERDRQRGRLGRRRVDRRHVGPRAASRFSIDPGAIGRGAGQCLPGFPPTRR